MTTRQIEDTLDELVALRIGRADAIRDFRRKAAFARAAANDAAVAERDRRLYRTRANAFTEAADMLEGSGK